MVVLAKGGALHLSRRLDGRVLATVAVRSHEYWTMGITEIVHVLPPHSHLLGKQFPSLCYASREINTAFGIGTGAQGGFEAYTVPADVGFDWSLLGSDAGFHVVNGIRTAARFSLQLATARVNVICEEDGSGRWVHWRELTPLVPQGLSPAEAEGEIAQRIQRVRTLSPHPQPLLCHSVTSL